MTKNLLPFLMGLAVWGTSATTPYAQESISVNLGTFRSKPCVRPEVSGFPGVPNLHSEDLAKVDAKIYLVPTNQRTTPAAVSCAQRIGHDLLENSSFSLNTQLLSETFQGLLFECMQKQNVGIQEVKAFLVSQSNCRVQ